MVAQEKSRYYVMLYIWNQFITLLSNMYATVMSIPFYFGYTETESHAHEDSQENAVVDSIDNDREPRRTRRRRRIRPSGVDDVSGSSDIDGWCH